MCSLEFSRSTFIRLMLAALLSGSKHHFVLTFVISKRAKKENRRRGGGKQYLFPVSQLEKAKDHAKLQEYQFDHG